MVRFAAGISREITHEIERKSVFWRVDFDLPEAIREQMSLAEIRPILGVFLMGFYADPLPGDVITYKGHSWRVTERQFEPLRWKSKGQRVVPLLKVEHLGRLPEEGCEDFDDE